MTALYSKLHPEYASYIYLLAPISLAVLNPIGYVLMEISKIRAKATEETQVSNCYYIDCIIAVYIPLIVCFVQSRGIYI